MKRAIVVPCVAIGVLSLALLLAQRLGTPTDGVAGTVPGPATSRSGSQPAAPIELDPSLPSRELAVGAHAPNPDVSDLDRSDRNRAPSLSADTDAGVLRLSIVSDDGGAPVPGARVEWDATTRETDARGFAVLAGIRTGTQYRISADGYETVELAARIRTGEPGPPRVVRLVLARNVLVRFVDPSGQAFRAEKYGMTEKHDVRRFRLELAAACVAPGRELPAPYETSHTIGWSSTGSEWNVIVRGRGPVCAHVLLGGLVVGCAPIASSASEVDVELDAATLAATITPLSILVVADDGGQPVSGARIRIAGRDVLANESGRLEMTLPVGKSIRIDVSAAGFAPSAQIVERPLPDPIVVRLGIGRRVRGRVLDASSAPAEGVQLRLYYRFEARGRDKPFARTDARGEFEFTEVTPGAYDLGLDPIDERTRVWSFESGKIAVDCTASDVEGIAVQAAEHVRPKSAGPSRGMR